MGIYVALERLFIDFPDGQVFRFRDVDPSADIRADAVEVDDVGAMNAHEMFGRKRRLHVLEPKERRDAGAVGNQGFEVYG